MIGVVEGISAAGKTTFTMAAMPGQTIPEFETMGQPPHSTAPLAEQANFWLEHNVRRFEAALRVEREHGFALCDTDPLKSHYDWCCARAGFISMDLFEAVVPLVRQAIADRRLGFADYFFVREISPAKARAQKEGDPTRTRSGFEKHLALQPHLLDWFAALAEVLPGKVHFRWPEEAELKALLESKTPEKNPRRFDVTVWDDLIDRLPR